MLKFIFAATEFEMREAIKKFGLCKLREEPFKVFQGDSAMLVISGIGLVNAALAYSWAVHNYSFEDSANIGAAGDVSGSFSLGEVCKISQISCVEPFDNYVFKIADEGVSLASSASPVISERARARAANLAKLVDMEAYSFASAAKLYSKNIEIIKFVSDFSPEHDIHANIRKLRHCIAELEDFWTVKK